MSRLTYNPKETKTGTGSLDEYTFDFKINDLLHLLVIEVDNDGVELQRVRGNDNTFLSSVTYDAVNGGGTVTLAANLTADHDLILLLANDAPTQIFEFRNKTSFTLRRFEDALDLIAGVLQRLTYRTKQAFKIHDLDNEETFNTQLPPGIADQAGRVFQVDTNGTGFAFGPSVGEIANAQGHAQAALVSAQAAAISAANAAISATIAAHLIGQPENANFTADYTPSRIYLVTNEVSVQLPEPEVDKVIRIKKTGSDNIHLLRHGSENIDGIAADRSFTSAKQNITLYTDGTDWFLI